MPVVVGAAEPESVFRGLGHFDRSTARRAPPLLPIQKSSHGSCRSQAALASISSIDSEHDLAAMVRDFIENGGDGIEHSSDEGAVPTALDELKALVVPSAAEQELRSLVVRALYSTSKHREVSACSRVVPVDSKVRSFLVRTLRAAGYDAGVCKSQWRTFGRIPGGEYEYVDVVLSESRLIVDLDFRSHFEIARPVQQYKAALKLLPTLFIGSAMKLKEVLVIMSQAAKQSLSQNSMHLPPWRTLDYLSAKWLSPYQRETDSLLSAGHGSSIPVNMRMCYEQIKSTRAALVQEVDRFTIRRGS